MRTRFFFMLFLAFLITNVYSQNLALPSCSITGPNQISLDQTATFSVASNIAQCTNCFDWDVSNANAIIVGSDINNSVAIKRVNNGEFCITNTYFGESGCNSCTKCFAAIPVNECGIIDVGTPWDLNALGDQRILITSTYELQSGWNIDVESSSFWITFSNNPSFEQYMPGVINTASGTRFQTNLFNAYCNNPVIKARVVIVAYNSAGQTCTVEKTHNNMYACGSPGGDDWPPSFTIVPNPIEENFSIKIDNKNLRNLEIQIFDKQQKLVKSFTTNELNKELFNVNDIESGVYYIRISSENQILYQEKLIKK